MSKTSLLCLTWFTDARKRTLNEQHEYLLKYLNLRDYQNLKITTLDPNQTIGAGVQFEASGNDPNLGPIHWFVRIKFDHPQKTFIFRAQAPTRERAFELVKISETFRMMPK